MTANHGGVLELQGRRWQRLLLWLGAPGMWFAWFSWDRVHLDVDGVLYSVARHDARPWQVVGCLIMIPMAAVIAYVWVRRRGLVPYSSGALVVLAAAAPLGFAVVWTRDAAQNPTQDGLFGIATMMMMIGGGPGMLILLALTESVVRRVYD